MAGQKLKWTSLVDKRVRLQESHVEWARSCATGPTPPQWTKLLDSEGEVCGVWLDEGQIYLAVLIDGEVVSPIPGYVVHVEEV